MKKISDPGQIDLCHSGRIYDQHSSYGGINGRSNTSEAHIHFQIQDGKSFFASAGPPISFQNIHVEQASNYDKFDPHTAQERGENDASTIQRGYCMANLTSDL